MIITTFLDSNAYQNDTRIKKSARTLAWRIYTICILHIAKIRPGASGCKVKIIVTVKPKFLHMGIVYLKYRVDVKLTDLKKYVILANAARLNGMEFTSIPAQVGIHWFRHTEHLPI